MTTDEAVKAAAVKIIRWGIDEARERDAMYDEAVTLLLASGEDFVDGDADAVAERIEAAINALIPTTTEEQPS